MNAGKKFEELIKKSAKHQGLDITRLKDAGFVGDRSESRRFTSKNICDFILYAWGNLAYIEAKSRQSSLTFKDITQRNDLLKKQHSLQASHKTRCGVAGILVEFQKTEEVYFVDSLGISLLESFTQKKSFNAKDCVQVSKEYPTSIYKISKYVPEGKRSNILDLEKIVGLPF